MKRASNPVKMVYGSILYKHEQLSRRRHAVLSRKTSHYRIGGAECLAVQWYDNMSPGEQHRRVLIQISEHICAVTLMQLLPHKDYSAMFDLIQEGFKNGPFYGDNGKAALVNYTMASELIDLNGYVTTSCITDSILTGFVFDYCKKTGNALFAKMLKVRGLYAMFLFSTKKSFFRMSQKECRFSKNMCSMRPEGQKSHIDRSYEVYFRKLMSRLFIDASEAEV